MAAAGTELLTVSSDRFSRFLEAVTVAIDARLASFVVDPMVNRSALLIRDLTSAGIPEHEADWAETLAWLADEVLSFALRRSPQPSVEQWLAQEFDDPEERPDIELVMERLNAIGEIEGLAQEWSTRTRSAVPVFGNLYIEPVYSGGGQSVIVRLTSTRLDFTGECVDDSSTDFEFRASRGNARLIADAFQEAADWGSRQQDEANG